YVYRGASTNSLLAGRYIYGDYISGRVWSLDYDPGSGVASSTLLFRTNGQNVSSFGLDEAGELYFSGYGNSAQLYNITGGDDQGPSVTDVEGVGSWTGLANGTDGIVNALAVDGGTTFVGGDFNRAGNTNANNIASYRAGRGWRTLSVGANGTVNALAVDSDGNLYAGGDFSSIGGVSARNIAVWNGSSWRDIGGTNGPVSKLGIAPDGNVYVGGVFASAGGVRVNNIARYNGRWTALIDAGTGQAGTNNEIRSIAFDEDGVLYVGGNFDTAGGNSANRIAAFDGSNWGTLGNGTSGFVQAIAITGSSVFAGGNFALAGGRTVNRIARWDRSSNRWQSLGNGVSGNVNALVHDGGFLYAGGNFEIASPDGNTDYRVNNIARWSAEVGWEALGTGTDVGTDNQVNALALGGSGGNLYAGGNFEEAGTADASSLAVWSTEQRTGTDLDGAVFEMQPQHNTNLRLDVRGVNPANSTLVDGFRRNGGRNQQWKFTGIGDNLYEIEPQHAIGQRLDVAGRSRANNTEIHIYESTGNSNQLWRAIPIGSSGLYRFEPQNAPGKRLDIENVDGVPRALSRNLDSGNSQRWRLIPVRANGAAAKAEPEATPIIALYPNPTRGGFTIDMDGADVTQVTVYSISGQQVYTEALEAATRQLQVSEDLAPGVYLVELSGPEGARTTKKLIVE
ncbi:MAG: RICIN domain-containing protein, partial [Pricia sp.]